MTTTAVNIHATVSIVFLFLHNYLLVDWFSMCVVCARACMHAYVGLCVFVCVLVIGLCQVYVFPC